MSERLRTIKISIEVDTNKSTRTKTFELGALREDETPDELFARFREGVALSFGDFFDSGKL